MELVRKDFIRKNNLVLSCFIVEEFDCLEVLFKAYDTAKNMGYKRPRNAIAANVPAKFKRTWGEILKKGFTYPGANFPHHTIFITEAGLLSLVFRSKLPQAIAFRSWLLEDVFPRIKTKMFSRLYLLPRRIVQSREIEEKQKHGYVYVAATEKMQADNIYKIGCTKNVVERLKQLNHTNFYETYQLLYVHECADKFQCEKKAHVLLQKYRIKQEFFKIEKSKFKSIIKKTFAQIL